VKSLGAVSSEVGSCNLPTGDYAVVNALSLGDIDSLSILRFNPILCGKVVRIDCDGGREIDAIVVDKNKGGGLALYQSTWNLAMGDLLKESTRCSVALTAKKMFKTNEPVCFYASGETSNGTNRKIGLFNTGNSIVMRSVLDNGVNGELDKLSPYFLFPGFTRPDQIVTFKMNDGSSHNVKLADCRDSVSSQSWS
jgi:hypothetical protein